MYFEGKEVNKMTTINTIATGANIKAMMKARQMTTADIQKACGFGTPQAIFKWFRGDTMPTIDNMPTAAMEMPNKAYSEDRAGSIPSHNL